jgi:AGZA family xanthine/uracil permease-like MFS transporter
MHSYALTGRDTVIDLPLLAWLSGQWTPGRTLFPAGGAALGYALAALVFLLAKYIMVPRAEDDIA